MGKGALQPTEKKKSKSRKPKTPWHARIHDWEASRKFPPKPKKKKEKSVGKG